MRIINVIQGPCQEEIYEAPSACLSSPPRIGGRGLPMPPALASHAAPPSCAVVPDPGGLSSRPGPFGSPAPRGSLSRAPRPDPFAPVKRGRASGGPAVFSSLPQALPGPLPCGPPSASGPGLGASSLSFLGLSSRDYLEPMAKSPTAPREIGGNCVSASHKKDPKREVLDRVAVQMARCGSFAMVRQCADGHAVARPTGCGYDWHEKCRERSHRRRKARWLPKLKKLWPVIHLVVTFPTACLPVTVGEFRRLSSSVTGILGRRGFDRGFRSWHYFGDKNPGVWRPHIHFMLGGGWVAPSVVDSIKAALRVILKADVVDVHVEYRQTIKQILHLLNYATKATFLDLAWAPAMAAEIHNFNGHVSWGWFDDPGPQKTERAEARRKALLQTDYFADKWVLPTKKKSLPEARLEADLCPTCGKPLGHWHRAEIDFSSGRWKSSGVPGVYSYDGSPVRIRGPC